MIEFKYRISKLYERALIKVAYMLPRSLVMWAYVRVSVHATTGKYRNTVVPELGMMEALKRWDVQ